MTPKSRARAIIERYMETPGATLENTIFMDVVKEIEAENEACAKVVEGFEKAHYPTLDAAGRNRADNRGMPLDEVAGLIAEKIRARLK